MLPKFVPDETFQFPMFWLNAVASENMPEKILPDEDLKWEEEEREETTPYEGGAPDEGK